MKSKYRWLLGLLLCAGGCTEGPGDSPGGLGTEALFELLDTDGRTQSGFYALPFPNDLRRDTDGTISLKGHQRSTALIEEYLQVIDDTVEGFGSSSPVFFRFAGPIDPGSLPASPEASRDEDASMYLVNIDPGSPHRGERTPLRFRFETRSAREIEANWLAALPYPGFALRPLTTYAAVVTRRVKDIAGDAVTPSADMKRVLGGEAATDAYAPLLAWLDEPGGDDRDDVASAAVFTTRDPTTIVRRARAVVYRDAPEPAPRNVTLVSEHEGYSLHKGIYDGPLFQEGTIPYDSAEDGGRIIVDAAGDPVYQRSQEIRFAVSLPPGPPPAQGWPLVIYTHGTGGGHLSFHHDGTARRMAAEGLAVLSHDAIHHGTRAPAGTQPELAFFNFFNPYAAVTNVQQGAIDNYQLVRLARTLTVMRAAQAHSFDAERLYYMGHSQGALTGVPFLPFEPDIDGVVISGGGSLLYLSLLHKTEPLDVSQLVKTLIPEPDLDEFNTILGLLQLYADPGDSVNYAPLLAAEPVADVAPKSVFISQGFVDLFTPVVSIAALGVAARATPVEPVLEPVQGFALAGIDPVAPPVTGNLNGETVVFLQYQAPVSRDGHFVVFDVPRAQTQHAVFLGSMARQGAATLVEVR